MAAAVAAALGASAVLSDWLRQRACALPAKVAGLVCLGVACSLAPWLASYRAPPAQLLLLQFAGWLWAHWQHPSILVQP